MSNMTQPIDSLLCPINDSSPAGVDLRENTSSDSPYYQVKDARAQARNIERKQLQGIETTDPRPHWHTVMQTGQVILSKHSKDLEVACWLVEAWVRNDGLRGLLTGLSLISGLIETHWQHLYPRPDEEGLTTRLASLAGLIGHEREGCLMSAIRNIAITDQDHALWEYQQALSDDNPDHHAIKLHIQQAALKSGPAFYHQAQQWINESLQQVQCLDALLIQHCPAHVPTLSHLTQVLADFQQHIRYLLRDVSFDAHTHTEVVPNEAHTEATETIPPHNTANAAISIATELQNRQQALSQLKQIADFFRSTEPHSPIPYLLARAIHWGNLPLPALLKELITDDTARDNTYHLTGIATEKMSTE